MYLINSYDYKLYLPNEVGSFLFENNLLILIQYDNNNFYTITIYYLCCKYWYC